MNNLIEHKIISYLQNPNLKNKGFELLLNLYKERLYWHIRKIVKLHEDADDILQNTFIKVYKNIHKFNHKSKLYTWLYRIATNESITYLKNKAKNEYTDINSVILKNVSSLSSDIYYSGNEIELKLQQCIAKLPFKQQLVFNMKYFEHLKYEEISKILDTSVGALKASYHIAVKKIRKDIVIEEIL